MCTVACGVASHLPLPPLASAAAGAELASSRVHFLYFLASFLLLKTALAAEDQMRRFLELSIARHPALVNARHPTTSVSLLQFVVERTNQRGRSAKVAPARPR